MNMSHASIFLTSKATLANHVYNAGMAGNAEGDGDDAEIPGDAAFVFKINGRVTDGTGQEIRVGHTGVPQTE